MRLLTWGLGTLIACLSLSTLVSAQDPTPTATAIYVPPPTPSEFTPPPYQQQEGQTLIQVAFGFNICPEELIDANRDVIPPEAILEHGSGSFFKPDVNILLPANLKIPPHEDCYTILAPVSSWDYPQIERDYNICLEEFAYLSRRYQVGNTEYDAVFLRKNAPPCVNEKGQRLRYFDEQARILDIPLYSDLPFIEDYDPRMPGYCPGDMVRVNPQFDLNTENPYSNMVYHYVTTARLFVPPGARRCEPFQSPEGVSLYELSQMTNVCMEDMLSASGFFLRRMNGYSGQPFMLPVDLPPCYDADGQRIGRTDRGLYSPMEGESFLDIARDQDVCLDDLWDANPVMETWNGLTPLLPEMMFLPDAPSCASPDMTMRLPANQTLHSLSLLTNVCVKRLIDANPSLQALDPETTDILPAGKTLAIPERFPCYYLTFSPYETYIKMRPYVCYAVPITEEADFIGHEPPITASGDTDLPHCYERTEGMTVIYENEPYTLYRIRGYESYTMISQCFEIPIDRIQNINAEDKPWKAYQDTTRFWGGLLIPQPHADCTLNTTDNNQHHQIYISMVYTAGYLVEDTYFVNYGDTLSSIGRAFGYPYQWIAQANNLSEPYTIYFLQELKMPSYPSLYTLIPVGGAGVMIVLASSAIYGLRSLHRRRTKGKKKNEAA